jgi:hypothetical protein
MCRNGAKKRVSSKAIHGSLVRDASLKKDTESFFREWLDASQWRTP